MPLYVAHGIAEVWLVDLQHRRLELFRDQGPGYRQILRPDPSQVVAPVLLPELRIQVQEIW